jgi:hypothetical protein
MVIFEGCSGVPGRLLFVRGMRSTMTSRSVCASGTETGGGCNRTLARRPFGRAGLAALGLLGFATFLVLRGFPALLGLLSFLGIVYDSLGSFGFTV